MLTLKNITKQYNTDKSNTVEALKGISVDFRSNEFVAILGPSGCGKTTLLNIVGGLDHYTEGDLQIEGISTARYTEKDWNNYRNHRIGFVFQSYNLIPHQTVESNVELALTLSGVSKAERRQRARKALDEVGLADQYSKKPNQLSGGQMQRVALARALVNNPQIVLADEPTGALDSVTSVQVMDLLKKVADNHLVIMVTHNGELAQKYATRIIKLHDGEVISDSNPLTEEEYRREKQAEQQAQLQASQSEKVKPSQKKKVKMSFWTALTLSFKNMLTKLGRTLMTSIAGSIGIIGVALVLALSNGFNLYIAKLQSDTLSGYPITISQVAADMDAIYEQIQGGINMSQDGKFPDEEVIHVYDPSSGSLSKMLHYNYISQEYYDFIQQFYADEAQKPADEQLTNGVQYSYSKTLNIISENNGTYMMVNTSSDSSDMTSAMMGSSSVFQESLGNSDFVLSQYDVLYGNYPTQPDEVAIIVDSRNRLSISTLDALGISYTYNKQEDTVVYDDISFEDILNKTFKVVFNDDYFVKNTNSFGTYYTTIDSIADAETKQNTLSEIYNSDRSYTLNVVGVLRINENAPLSLYSTGILYLPSLTQIYLEDSRSSEIALAQTKENVYVSADGNTYMSVPIDTVINSMEGAGYKNVTEEQAYQYALQQVGASTLPSAIYIYPKDFQSKDEILNYLNTWNTTEQGKNNKIVYTDATQILSSSMGQMIDIISYVLIALASISLVVSSVMIGIITYVSVIERTKEIGVLRSLGASKNDVSNVFNAETLIIGFIAGVIGIAVTYLLSIPLNLILTSLAGGMLSTNLVILNPLSALMLIAISCVLTFVSGSIPSRVAAKMDPVKALRTE